MVQKKTSKTAPNGKKTSKGSKPPKATGDSKMTMCAVPNIVPTGIRERRPERRVVTGKRFAMTRAFPGKSRATARRSLDPCDNSNDSGLGFDQHADHSGIADRLAWSVDRAQVKRPKMDIKLEDMNEDCNDNFSFPDTIRSSKDTMSIIRTAPASTVPSLSVNNSHTNTTSGRAVPRCTPLVSRGSTGGAVTLTSQLPNSARDCDIGLRIVSQPEQQHRARYQTEGSRGAVKDRSGNGFPVVQLTGYHKPATLQVFIGTDVGKVTPHMFYQACRVSGKNSTPCVEKKIDGTVVIELQLDPSKDMIGTCDCVGILKERNVDVEHRFPDQIGSRSKKKSTRCRMVFRTSITHENGMQETLQVCSQPIVCTQPPGIPEICKKSLTSCPATGGLELFVLGKNFLKDTRVFFQQVDDQGLRWEQSVIPDKEFLQQTHLVCVVPPYVRPDITEPVTVRLLVVSSGKTSEPHQFVYTPTSGAVSSVCAENAPAPFLSKTIWSSMSKHEQGIMPPPGTSQMPLAQRRSSINMANESSSPPLHSLKQELMDENSQNSIIDPLELRRERFRHISESSLDVQQGDSNMTMINDNSIDMLRRTSVGMSDNSNMSVLNENSMEAVVRRNSLGRESTLDVPLNSALTTLVNRRTHCDKVIIPSGFLPAQSRPEDLKVMDLRMKMPTAVSVSDLASTHAPSMATLHSFGVTEPTNIPLPAQTAQSVENYLTTIESKRLESIAAINDIALNNKINHIINTAQQQNMLHQQKVVQQQQQGIIAHNTIMSGNFPTPLCTDTNLVTMQTAVENELMTKSLNAGQTEKMLHSPQDVLIGNKSPLLNTQQSLLVPPAISTTLSSPILDQTDHHSPISPEVILNSQISPSMMCANVAQDTLLGSREPNLMQQVAGPPVANGVVGHTSPLPAQLTADPEKVILLKAAVDLYETQKKISELDQINPKTTIEQVMLNHVLSTSAANSHATLEQQTSNSTVNKSAFVVPATVKDMDIRMGEKKNEDRMIPTGFATMSENELINMINPSCFDQV